MYEDRKNETNTNSNKGIRTFTEDELIQMLKNPLCFHQKNIKQNGFFDSIYNMIDELKKEIGYNDEKQINELEKEAKDLQLKCQKLIERIQEYFKINNIEFNNIKDINKNKNNDKKINIYIELINLNNNIMKKIKKYEDNNKKFNQLNDLIKIKENEVNNYIMRIQNEIENALNLVEISNIFNEYKEDLLQKMKNEIEYQEHPDIFNEKNEEEFKIEDLYQFIKDCLKNHSFSITKRDITNYNLFIEVLREFNELNFIYENNVDLDLNA